MSAIEIKVAELLEATGNDPMAAASLIDADQAPGIDFTKMPQMSEQ